MKPKMILAACALVSLGSLAVVACGGSSSAGVISDVDGGGGQDGAANPNADGGGTTVPPDGSAGGDGGGGGDAGGGADGATAEAPIDPFAVGNTWTYDVTQVGVYPLCPSGSHQGKVLGSAQRDGKLAFETQSLCANAGTFYYAVDGDVVYWDNATTWTLVLDSPVVEGHTWSNGVTTFAWHDVGSVTVPAGTFPKCWKAQDTAGPSYTVFCRGVGPVNWSYRDATGNGYDALLTAKSF
jgi:hypothetical protein